MKKHLGLTGMLAVAALYACGGGDAKVVDPSGVGTAPTASASGTPSSAPSAAATPAGTGSAAAGGGSVGSTQLVKPSTMVADLTAMGLDLKNLPPLDKLKPEQMRKVMTTFTKALGWQCKDCHGTGKFEAPTPMKNVTTHMWNEFVKGITFDGGPLYCDSCHQGKAKYLDKSDKKALGAWMDQEFDKKMKRGSANQTCASCHGEPFNPDFMDGWKKK